VNGTIAVRGLTKRYGAVTAVSALTFEVGPGVLTGFLGPNGAGKTTTLRMLLGLVAPTAGEALIDGRRYAGLDEPRRVVGAVLETTGFHPGRTGMAAEGRTVLMSSHVLSEVAQTVDQVIIIAGGTLRHSGPLAGLTARGETLEAAFLRLTGTKETVTWAI
jgi:ABC-2 type transport system ATP-binding protein